MLRACDLLEDVGNRLAPLPSLEGVRVLLVDDDSGGYNSVRAVIPIMLSPPPALLACVVEQLQLSHCRRALLKLR